MIRRSTTLEIEASPQMIWAVLGRYMHIDEFAPFVKSTDALTIGEDGVGSKRRNNFEIGTTMVEEVTVWLPDQQLRVRASEFGSLPFSEVEAEIILVPLENGRSKVTWSLDYLPKYGAFGWLMGQTVMKLSMGKFLGANLKGLAERISYNQSKIV
ncbi:MAG: SRPBCC family protein [Rhizobiales bacterium]|nr:SRPBCC family protein [Hyphomicrobiales bacterium]